MQSEDFDKKIKQAAEHHHPAYDEKAWVKMEKLLDKHLPQKEEKKRRFLFFLLLFLLMGAGTWLLISKPWENKQSIAKSGTNTPSSPAETENGNTNGTNTSNEKGAVNGTDKSSVPGIDGHQESAQIKTDNTDKNPVTEATETNTIQKTINTTTTSASRKKDEQVDISVLNAGKAKKAGKGKLVTTKPSDEYTDAVTNAPVSKTVVPPVPVQSAPVSEPVVKGNEPAAQPNITTAEENKVAVTKPAAETKKEEPPVAASKKAEPKKEKGKKKSEFFFSLSAGPDVSNVGNDKLGKMKLLAGAGFGYTFKERLTLRTGFYTSRKVYSAGPEEYHAPAYFYTLYPYLENVNADCKVYEIPLTVSYNFANTGKQNWFAAAGISSFLMKKETYDYQYKYTPSGQSYNATWTILDKNKHYFSVATLSGGYRRNLGKNFFVMAEPYVKLPLGGVGFGKVRLNSGGVLFTVGIKPFAK